MSVEGGESSGEVSFPLSKSQARPKTREVRPTWRFRATQSAGSFLGATLQAFNLSSSPASIGSGRSATTQGSSPEVLEEDDAPESASREVPEDADEVGFVREMYE